MFEFDFGRATELTPEEMNEKRLLLAVSLRDKFTEESETISEQIATELESLEKNLNLLIDLDNKKLSDYNLRDISNIVEYAKIYNVPVNIYLKGGSQFNSTKKVQMLFDQQSLSALQKLNQSLVASGLDEIKFVENINNKKIAWTMDQVVAANQKIDEIAKKIKSQKLSPYEAMAYIHSLATQFIFKENNGNKAITRGLVGITNTNYISCEGFSTFVKAIIDKLDMKGLSCETLDLTLTTTLRPLWLSESEMQNFGSKYQNNVIHIHDPKYKVSGTYISDSCFDSFNPTVPGLTSFANFMFPVTDLLNYKGMEYYEPNNNSYSLMESIMGEKKSNDRKQLSVIKDYGNDSTPIPLETLSRCLLNTFKKIYPKLEEQYLKEYVDKIIEDSKLLSKSTFNENAKNEIATTAYQEYAAFNQFGE